MNLMQLENNRMEKLLETARKRHGKISPCGSKQSFLECLSRIPDAGWCLWYNTDDGSTHVIVDNTNMTKSTVS